MRLFSSTYPFMGLGHLQLFPSHIVFDFLKLLTTVDKTLWNITLHVLMVTMSYVPQVHRVLGLPDSYSQGLQRPSEHLCRHLEIHRLTTILSHIHSRKFRFHINGSHLGGLQMDFIGVCPPSNLPKVEMGLTSNFREWKILEVSYIILFLLLRDYE